MTERMLFGNRMKGANAAYTNHTNRYTNPL